MAEELGRIEKPEAGSFTKPRKLFFVPLIFAPAEPEGDLGEKIRGYWAEVDAHVANLEVKLGSVTKIYHELVPVGGEEGSRLIEELNSASYKLVRSRLDTGAEVQPIEDVDLLTEFMDWTRCLAIGLQNQRVLARVYESYSEAHSSRNKGMVQKMDETLKEGDVGILLMREGHQLQFPSDIEVFYVAPPALDDLKRWLRDREREVEAEGQADGSGEKEGA